MKNIPNRELQKPWEYPLDLFFGKMVYYSQRMYVLKKNCIGVYCMKKIVTAAVVLCALFVFAGCNSQPAANSPAAAPQSGLPEIVRNARRNAPEGVLIGIGSAKMQTQSLSKSVAETRARAEISRAMNSMVQDMVRDYQAGSELSSDALAFQEQITVTLSKATLQGAIIDAEDYIDGTYYVVMYLSRADVVKEINQSQAAAKLAVPAMASFNAEDRMNDAFARENGRDLTVRSSD
jgi:hypothetical protein